MTRDELLTRLKSIEWNDIEFKEAAWAVPKDALSTVSAFANTDGGHLVFGVKQENGKFSISGVIEADKVQNDFLGHVRDSNKISVFLPIEGQLHALDEGTVIVFMCRKHRETRNRCSWIAIPRNPISVAAAETTPAPATSWFASCVMHPIRVMTASHCRI
ncbi:MAG: ATP-binding protein [Nitrosomonadales bacterium]